MMTISSFVVGIAVWGRFRPEGVQVAMENAQDRKFVGGAQQISDKLAEALQGRVVLNAPVASIEWSPERGAAARHAVSLSPSLPCFA
jgi:monoamine oxidase